MKGMMPCCAGLTSLLVANLLILVKMDLAEGTGTFLIEVEFPAMEPCGVSTKPEVRWWYVCTVQEVERMGSTAVRYLIQQMSSRPYTLECTQQAPVLVSNTWFCSTIVILWCLCCRIRVRFN